MAISEEDVARVRAATDIVALIGEHAALKRQGTKWVGLCPFHQEKTPSFSVNAEIGVYYCFGCQRSGDAITFLRELERLDFAEAVRALAERAGITITEDAASSADRTRRAPLFDAVSRAVAFYHERLLSAPDAGKARDYLRSRGYDGQVVREFRLGWAPDDWDTLARHLGASPKVLSDAGLGFVNRVGRQQDSFRSRVIFPIFDPSGKAIALGGRVLPHSAANDQQSGPKYKNSPEGPIYSKRRTLYGLNWAKKNVVSTDEVIVCEGYTDVIGFFLCGLPRAVATCGTALGEEHFRVLGNFARRVVLAFDADSAGQSGATRVYEWERSHRVDVAVAELPGGTDPGELATRDPEALRAAVSAAKPFLAFRIDRVLQAADLQTAEGRARAAESAAALVAEHPNDLVRDQYLMVVADRTRLDPGSLRALVERDLRGASNAGGPVARQGSPSRQGISSTPERPERAPTRRTVSHPTESQRAGLEALRLIVQDAPSVAKRLEPVVFADPVQRAAFEALSSGTDPRHAIVLAEARGEPVADLVRRVSVEEPSADAEDVILQLIRLASRRALAELDAEVRLAPENFAEAAAVSARIKKTLEELDEPDLAVLASERLLAWLVERGDETI